MEDKTNCHSLQQCDASGVFSVLPNRRDEVAVVDDKADEHGDRHKGCEARRRDLEASTHGPVKGSSLFDEEGMDLCNHGAGDEGDYQDGEHLHHLLCFFHLGHCAKSPLGATFPSSHCCLVQKPILNESIVRL